MCCESKMIRKSFKSKDHISTSRPLELLHIDLYGKIEPCSLGYKSY
jgi:hypothetical protein